MSSESRFSNWKLESIGMPGDPYVGHTKITLAECFTLHPKTRSVVAWAGTADFAWVDDEITDSDREWIHEHHSGAALLLEIDPHRGLTGPDFAILEEWLLGKTGFRS